MLSWRTYCWLTRLERSVCLCPVFTLEDFWANVSVKPEGMSVECWSMITLFYIACFWILVLIMLFSGVNRQQFCFSPIVVFSLVFVDVIPSLNEWLKMCKCVVWRAEALARAPIHVHACVYTTMILQVYLWSKQTSIVPIWPSLPMLNCPLKTPITSYELIWPHLTSILTTAHPRLP